MKLARMTPKKEQSCRKNRLSGFCEGVLSQAGALAPERRRRPLAEPLRREVLRYALGTRLNFVAWPVLHLDFRSPSRRISCQYKRCADARGAVRALMRP